MFTLAASFMKAGKLIVEWRGAMLFARSELGSWKVIPRGCVGSFGKPGPADPGMPNSDVPETALRIVKVVAAAFLADRANDSVTSSILKVPPTGR